MLQDGGGQVQTTQAQWRQQQLEMQFDAMSAMEKQQYLAQRNLLLPNPSANWGQQVQLQQHTIQVSWSDSDEKLLANVPSKKII